MGNEQRDRFRLNSPKWHKSVSLQTEIALFFLQLKKFVRWMTAAAVLGRLHHHMNGYK